MHVGLIVGIGPAATDFYYRRLIATLAAAAGVALELTMSDTTTLLRNQAVGDAAAQVAIYRHLAERLKAVGAAVLAITSIAGHFCIDEFLAVAPLPVIDMLSVVDRGLAARGLHRVGILGTSVVMQTSFYGAARTTEIIPPPAEMLRKVHDAYVAMASTGTVTPGQRDVFFSAGRAMLRDSGVEAIILGGTDLALAFAGQDPGFPVFDCAAAHADAMAEAAMT